MPFLRFFFLSALIILLLIGVSVNPEYSFAAPAPQKTEAAKAPAKSKSSAPAKSKPAAKTPSKTKPGAKSSSSKSSASAKGPKKNSASQSPKGFSLTAGAYKGAVLYNVEAKKTVYASKADVQVPPASLTKIMSIYVAEDTIRIKKLNRRVLVPVSKYAAGKGGSRMGLSAGDKVPLDDLLRGMAVASGNDASVAVAEFIGGSEKNFVAMMNRKARTLGMTRTVFKNANGLPAKGQLTTARDMLTLAKSYIAAYPGNIEKFHNFTSNTYKGCVVGNANSLLRNFKGADGLKTGYVNASGYNLISTARRDGVRLIGVVLGAPGPDVRERESCSLLEAGFGPLMASAPKAKTAPAKAPGASKPKAAPGKAVNTAKSPAKSKPAVQNTSGNSAKRPAAKPPAKAPKPSNGKPAQSAALP